MANVPNTGTFSLQDVTNSVHGDVATGRSLSGAFTAADGTFDATYQGSKNEIDDFRNYQAKMVSGQLVFASGGTIKRSTDFGATFAANATSYPFQQGCISGDNKYVILSQMYYFGAKPYRSTDGGLTFAVIPSGNIPSYYQCNRWVAMSSNGAIMAMCQSQDYPGDMCHILKSTNYGLNWQSCYYTEGSIGFNTVCMSGDGQYWLVAMGNVSYMRNTNYGIAGYWVDMGMAFFKIECSVSGQYAVGIQLNGTESIIYLSSNYGYYWSEIYRKNDGDAINSINISGDGNVIVITSWWWMAISTNRGASWSVKTDLNVNTAYGETIALSYSGQYIMLEGPTTSAYRSNNYGASNIATTIAGAGCYGMVINKYQI